MADPRATVDAMSKAERDHLIRLGFLAEGFTFPDMLMADAVANILASPAAISKLSVALPPLIKVGNLTESLQQLSIFLENVPHDNSLVKIYTSTSIMNVITFIVIGLRLYSRTKITKKMWPEDWWAVASIASIFCLLITYIICLEFANHDSHLWDVNFNRVRKWQLALVFCGSTFSLGLIPVKFTFAVFYYRICPEKWYRRAIIVLMVAIVAISIAGVLIWVFQSHPIDFWNHNLNPDLIYYDRVTIFTIWGSLTVVTDVILLLLPIWKVSKLHFRTKKEKLVVVGMFAAGGLICVANILRVIFLNHSFTDVDATYVIAMVSYWALLELDLAIIISCFPALKHLFVGRRADKLNDLASKIIRSIRPKRIKNPDSIEYSVEGSTINYGKKSATTTTTTTTTTTKASKLRSLASVMSKSQGTKKGDEEEGERGLVMESLQSQEVPSTILERQGSKEYEGSERIK